MKDEFKSAKYRFHHDYLESLRLSAGGGTSIPLDKIVQKDVKAVSVLNLLAAQAKFHSDQSNAAVRKGQLERAIAHNRQALDLSLAVTRQLEIVFHRGIRITDTQK